MRDTVNAKLRHAVSLYRDFVAALPDDALGRDLPQLPSNSIGSQLWCVVGARESYTRAIRAGAWQGFACGLTKAESKQKEPVTEHLERTAALAQACLNDPTVEWTTERDRLLMDLLVHETQHHGQLIRYLYGNRLPIPDSWKDTYTLD